MAQWQAPSTHNERPAEDVGVVAYGSTRPFLDATGRVKWWSGTGALPAGTTPLFVTVRASDQHRVFSTDAANERRSVLFGTHVIIR